MASVSSIPFVGKALDRIYDVVIDKMYRGLCYMLCYSSFVKDLESEIKEIEVHQGRVSKKAEEERANGKTVENHVTEWQTQVQQIKTSADDLCKQRPSTWNCLNCVHIPNPVSRFQIGRKAAHEAKNVADLTLSGEKLLAYEIAYPPADENRPISDTTYQKFESRDAAYKKLWGALVKEDGHPIIGIYGMPGVGKTRMMEKSWNDAKDKKIFTKVTRANLGAGEINVIKVQNELAGYLGCHLDSPDNEVRRASQLKESLKSEGKTLVVLDDVWGPIPFEKMGISLGDDLSKCFKVLLTSRLNNVCLQNGCIDPIKLNALTSGEAWDMFEDTVGTSKVNSFQNTSLAEKVCTECGGLPLLILALGNALKFASEDSWKHALSQLENCEFDEIDGIETKVYTCIRLSFDMLRNDTRTCLLLSSLFAEDADIDIMMLADLATGSGLLNPGGNVRGLVDNLKGSSLLLEGKSHDTVKIHDVIRDVARSVAARDQNYAFLFVTGGRHLPLIDNYRSRKLIHFVESKNFQRLTGMVCPKLHTLWLECNNTRRQKFPESIFRQMGVLKNLIIKGMCVFPGKMPVQTFDKLTTLMLEGCDINKMWLSIAFGNLETLRISDCGFPQYPIDFPMMKSLRKLQLLSDGVIYMVPNAISSLSPTLTELHIPNGFIIIDVERKRLPISSEINKLTALTSLNILLEDSESCPAEHIVANLLDFRIYVGSGFSNSDVGSETRSVFFRGTNMEGGQQLAERAEEVDLQRLTGSVQNGLSSNKRDSYSNLKKLSITSCFQMEHLFGVPQFEIKKSQTWFEIQQSQPTTSFTNLTSLTISRCGRLKYVFSASVAKCLLQLEVLHVSECIYLEVVIWNKSATDGEIIFPNLKSLLLLQDNRRLRKFCGILESTDADSPDGSHSLFDGTVVFPALKNLSITDYHSEIWGENCYKNNSFSRLKFLELRYCSRLKFAISLGMLDTFMNLESLKVQKCHSMTSDVETSISNGSPSAIVALRSISLCEMESLTQTSLNSSTNLYPNLELVHLKKCNRLTNVFLPSTAKHLFHLKELVVEKCYRMTEIIGEEGEEKKYGEFVFPELTKLTLTGLPTFKPISFDDSLAVITAQHQSSGGPKLLFPKLVEWEQY